MKFNFIQSIKATFKYLTLAGLMIITSTAVDIARSKYTLAASNAINQIRQMEKQSPKYTNSFKFKLYLNGEQKQLEIGFILVNGRTFLPLREVGNLLGATADWKQEEQLATLQKGNTLIEIPIGYSSAAVNNTIKDIDTEDTPGNQTVSVKTEVSGGGVTWLPIRFLSENLGYTVRFYPENNIIHIYNTETEPQLNLPSTSEIYVHPFFKEHGGVVLEGFIPADGNYATCLDFDGDGKINGMTAEEFNKYEAERQASEVASDIDNYYRKTHPAPTTPGKTGGEWSSDKMYRWNALQNRWDFQGNDDTDEFHTKYADAFYESEEYFKNNPQ